MKKKIIPFIFLLIFVSCNQSNKANNLFHEVISMFENANLVEWKGNTPEKIAAINKLDKAIKLQPNWWLPYHEKIQILKIGSYEEYAKDVNDVYSLWLKNGNNLEDFRKFSYACSLYCSNNEAMALQKMENIYSEYSKSDLKEEQKIMYLFSGIIVGNITETNLRSSVLKLFDESVVQLIEGFFIYFNESPKEALWAYV